MEKEYKENSPLLKVVPCDDRGYPDSTSTLQNIRNVTNRIPRFYIGVGAVVLILSLLTVAVSFEVNFQRKEQSYLLRQEANPGEELISFGPLLDFPLGKILPISRLSREGRNFLAFYKVPYAKPPLGERRFELSEAVEPWDGIRNVTEVAPQCIQKVKYSPIDESAGEEDCLYINIYTPKIPTDVNNEKELMPTLVYFHGGGPQGNGSRYGPQYFMDENVVLITTQFRLGALGHLKVPGSTITGNMGHKDQVLALKWVKEYIKYFGGDPNRVMIFGNSYGATHTGLHLLSPMSTGLFHRAILQSGGTIFHKIMDSKPEESNKALARETNCSMSSTKSFIDCLKNYNASELAIIQKSDIVYETVIEIDDGSGNAFMLDYPMNIYRSGKMNKASVIIGVNSAEAINLFNGFEILRSVETTESVNENWTDIAPTLLNYETSALDPDEVAIELKELYFGNNSIGNDTWRNLTDMITDRFMTHAAKVEGTFHSAINDVYMYYLTRQAAKTYAEKALEGFPPGNYGPAHADELQFLFLYYDYPYIPIDSEYYKFSRLLIKLWSNFAASGKPGQDWKPFRPKDGLLDWCMLDDQPKMTDILVPRMQFWDRFSAEELGYE